MSADNKHDQVSRMRSAISKVVAIGPDFLAKKIPAGKMAHTMVKAMEDYAKQAKKEGDIHPQSNEARELQEVLQEIADCGSGFLADRCDADCVARTISYLVDEFSDKAKV